MTNSLQQLVIDNVPLPILEQLTSTQSTIYEEARHMAFQTTLWERPEAESVFPINRRAMFEGALRRAARAAGVPFEDRQHHGDNYWYVMVKAGSLWITAHHVDHPKRFVRNAMSRKQHRAVNKLLMQPCLVGALQEELPSLDGVFYAQILHGLIRERVGDEIRTLPFMTMAFPHPERNAYVDAWDMSEMLQLYSSRGNVEALVGTYEHIVLPDVTLRPDAKEVDRREKQQRLELRKNHA